MQINQEIIDFNSRTLMCLATVFAVAATFVSTTGANNWVFFCFICARRYHQHQWMASLDSECGLTLSCWNKKGFPWKVYVEAYVAPKPVCHSALVVMVIHSLTCCQLMWLWDVPPVVFFGEVVSNSQSLLASTYVRLVAAIKFKMGSYLSINRFLFNIWY